MHAFGRSKVQFSGVYDREFLLDGTPFQDRRLFITRLNQQFTTRWRARILAQTGAFEAALGEIERLLREPSATSVHTLRLDPGWDPIRGDPRFQAVLVKYAIPEPVR